MKLNIKRTAWLEVSDELLAWLNDESSHFQSCFKIQQLKHNSNERADCVLIEVEIADSLIETGFISIHANIVEGILFSDIIHQLQSDGYDYVVFESNAYENC